MSESLMKLSPDYLKALYSAGSTLVTVTTIAARQKHNGSYTPGTIEASFLTRAGIRPSEDETLDVIVSVGSGMQTKINADILEEAGLGEFYELQATVRSPGVASWQVVADISDRNKIATITQPLCALCPELHGPQTLSRYASVLSLASLVSQGIDYYSY